MKKITFKCKGVSPLMMHNARLANPLDPIVIEIKKLTGKRKKTEDDLLQIARLEWEGGLYFNGQPYVPADNILATLINAAKKKRLGKQFQAAVIIEDAHIPLIYKGPKTIEKLWKAKEFFDYRSVVIKTVRIMRARPIFKDWEITFTVIYDESVLNETDITEAAETAGTFVGLCDYRPRYGRFNVEEIIHE
jgi:hypothetical protein